MHGGGGVECWAEKFMLCTHRCINQPPYLSVFYFFCMLHPLADICNPSTHTHTHTHKPYMLVCHNLRYMVLSQSPTTFLCLITCLCIISPMFHSLYYLLVSHNLCYMVLAYSIHYKIMSHSLHSMVLSHTFLCHIASTTCSCPMPFLHCKI